MENADAGETGNASFPVEWQDGKVGSLQECRHHQLTPNGVSMGLVTTSMNINAESPTHLLPLEVQCLTWQILKPAAAPRTAKRALPQYFRQGWQIDPDIGSVIDHREVRSLYARLQSCLVSHHKAIIIPGPSIRISDPTNRDPRAFSSSSRIHLLGH